MEQTGEVVKVQDGMLTIRFDRPEACEKCSACDGSKHQTLVKLPGSAQVGDLVKVHMPEGQVAKASLVAYVIPLGGLLLGLGAGAASGRGDLITLAGGIAGLGIALFILNANEKRLKKDPKWHPQLVAVEKRQSELGDRG